MPINDDERERLERIVENAISEQNPWLDKDNKTWFNEDGALRNIVQAEAEGLFEPPRIYFFLIREFITPMFEDSSKYGVLVIRGPRRIGKTSTLKYIIKNIIKEKSDNRLFIYLSLDSDELFFDMNRKRYLRFLIHHIITKFKRTGQPLFIILDEVTFYKGWARAIKNLIDSGDIGPGIGVIATGSYSVDLSSAKRELSGRYGPLGEIFGGEQFFYPRRFIEVAESILGSNFNRFISKFASYGRRMGIIEYLAGHQTEVDNQLYNYEKVLRNYISKYYYDLHNIFENVYLYTGGYPRKIYEAVVTQRNGRMKISDARYCNDIFELLVTDATKFSLSSDTIKKILLNITSPCMYIKNNYKNLISNLGLNKKEVEKYIDYMTNSGLITLLPSISSQDQIKIDVGYVSPEGGILKLLINDPAAFISIYFCSRGFPSVFYQAKKLFADNKVAEQLFESIIISHLQHMPAIKRGRLFNNLAFILLDKGKDGLSSEPCDGIAWYPRFGNDITLIGVEAKHLSSGTVNISQIKERAQILKKFNIQRLICVTNTAQFEIADDYVIMPAEIFLTLM